MDQILTDLRFALRLLTRVPGFAVTAILVLALGIGANSAIFSVVDAVLIRPLPYADPGRLAMIWEDASAFGMPKNRPAPANFVDWKQQNQVFTGMAAMHSTSANLSGGGPPEEIVGRAVGWNLFPLLGVQPFAGRTFSEEEDRSSAKVVVLSYRLWQRRFAGDPALIGRTISMNDEKYTVAGVMPRDFYFPASDVQYWAPLGLPPDLLHRRNSHFLNVIARLKPGIVLSKAQAEMTAIAKRLEQAYPNTNRQIGAVVTPLKDQLIGDTRTALLALLGAAACILLIACANVANLLLARAANRQREIALRMAIGAGRGQLIRLVLIESSVLAFIGGIAGLFLAQLSMSILARMVPSALAGSVCVQLSLPVLGFTAAVSLVTGLAFGLIPAIQMSGRSLDLSLRQGGRTSSGRTGIFRDALMIGEVGLTLVLLAGAGLLIQTLVRLRAVDAGFRSDHVLTAEISIPLPKYAHRVKRTRFFDDVLARVRSLPGVRMAGLTSDLPFTSRGNYMSFAIENQPGAPGLDQSALYRLVSAGYLEALQAQLKAGRFLRGGDREGTLPVAMINETFARQYWRNQDPLGHRIQIGTGPDAPWLTIAGVVRDIRERGLDYSLMPAVYVPYPQTGITYFLPAEIAVRTAIEPAALTKALQDAVWSIDPEQPVSAIRTMDDIAGLEVANRRQVLDLLGAFAALALVLASVGLYGVLSYSVAQRAREIGVRIAMGAAPWRVVRMIAGHGAGIAAAGVVLGVAAARVSTRLLAALLFGVQPGDASTLAWAAAVLFTVAVAACAVPAWRAARMDPMIVLRIE